MVKYVFGVPGSGKSYYLLSQVIIPALEQGRIVISTIPLNEKEHIDGYFYLSYDDMIIFRDELKAVLSSEVAFDQKVEFMKEFLFDRFGSLNLLFVIDECHLYGISSDEPSPSVKWVSDWVSIHRHFSTDNYSQDIYFATQTPNRALVKITTQCESLIYLLPSSLRTVPGMLEAEEYASFKALLSRDKTLRLATYRIRFRPEILEMYKSGSKISGHSGFRRKFYLLFFFLFVILLFVIYQFSHLLFNSSEPSLLKKSEKKVPSPPPPLSHSVDTNSTFHRVCAIGEFGNSVVFICPYPSKKSYIQLYSAKIK